GVAIGFSQASSALVRRDLSVEGRATGGLGNWWRSSRREVLLVRTLTSKKTQALNRTHGCSAACSYWRCAEAPASSRRRVRKVAAERGSARASSATVAENCGDWGRKRTLITSCWRTVIRALSSSEGSCFQWVRVVRMTGPGS